MEERKKTSHLKHSMNIIIIYIMLRISWIDKVINKDILENI